MELRRILGLHFWGVQSYSSRRGEQSAHAVMVEPSIEKLVRWNPLLPRGDSDLLKVYLEINLRGFDEEANEGSAEAWDRNKDALLPILVKGWSWFGLVQLLRPGCSTLVMCFIDARDITFVVHGQRRLPHSSEWDVRRKC